MAEIATDKDKIELAKFISSAASDNIKIADTKATFVFGAISVVTGALLGKIAKVDWQNVAFGRSIILISISLLFIVLAFKYTLLVLYPRLTKGKTSGLIFFEDIAIQSFEEYSKKFNSLTTEQIANEYYNQAHALSKVASKKFKALRIGMIHTMITIPLLIITFLSI